MKIIIIIITLFRAHQHKATGMKMKLVWKKCMVEMALLLFRKCVQKGDRITPLYGNGDSMKQVLCLHRFICYSRYPLA